MNIQATEEAVMSDVADVELEQVQSELLHMKQVQLTLLQEQKQQLQLKLGQQRSGESTFPPLAKLHAPIPVDPLSAARAKGTLKNQDSLPKMPIPELKNTIERYLSFVLPYMSPAQQDETKQRAAKFLENEGPLLQAKLLEYDKMGDNFMEHFYREIYSNYSGSNYELNPTFFCFPSESESTGPAVAAKLVSSVLQHYVQVRDGNLKPETTRSGALCMRQVPWIHASARICRPGTPDEIVSFLDTSKHIVALYQGAFFKLQVVDAQGGLIASETLLKARFEEIVSMAEVAPDTSGRLQRFIGVGALTSGPRNPWEQARVRLSADPTNKASLATIDSALCIVCLDDVRGLNDDQMQRNVLYGLESTVSNRWLDKPNFIVCADGRVGFNWEHSVLDGHTQMVFFTAMVKGFYANVPVNDDVAATKPRLLALNPDAETQAAMAAASTESLRRLNNLGCEMLEFHEFGADFIKKSNNSPDGFVQAALEIAFYKLYQRLPVVYESVLAKKFKHGRVTVGRNMNHVIAQKLKQVAGLPDDDFEARDKALRAMIADISSICRLAASAQDFDRHFLGLRGVAKALGLETPSICQGEAWAKMSTIDLCTSHCGAPPISFFGFEPPSAKGFSVGYYVASFGMQFAITSYDPAMTKAFREELVETLVELRGIVRAAMEATMDPKEIRETRFGGKKSFRDSFIKY